MLPRVSDVPREVTHRLIPARYSDRDESVLTRLTDDLHDLNALFELEGATNDRLLGEAGALPGITVRELVLVFPTRISSMQHSPIPGRWEAVSTDRSAAHGTRRSPARLPRSKSPITKAKNSRKSIGRNERPFLMSISSPSFEATFTTFAPMPASKIAWTPTATKLPSASPRTFLGKAQPVSSTPAFATKAEPASPASAPPS